MKFFLGELNDLSESDILFYISLVICPIILWNLQNEK